MSDRRKRRERRERIMRRALLACALTASVTVVMITLALTLEAWPAVPAIAGSEWSPYTGRFGIGPMMWGSLTVTAGALLLSVPIGVGVALYVTEVAPPVLGGLMRGILQWLSAVPSVVYGFIGLSVLVPAIRQATGGLGYSVLAGALVLAVMVLPTIAAVAENALRALPPGYREGARALGATSWQAVRRVLLPAARSGVATAVVLGLGRALGETTAMLMVTGNMRAVPLSPLDPARTLTGNIALEMAYAVGRHQAALFACGALLLAMILAVNAFARRVGR